MRILNGKCRDCQQPFTLETSRDQEPCPNCGAMIVIVPTKTDPDEKPDKKKKAKE